MRKTIVAAAVFIAATSGAAFAGNGVVTGAAGGAATGAIVGGPAGAAVGGVAGAVAGATLDPPPDEVVTYVEKQPAPPEPVVVHQKIVVGKPLPQTVTVTPVPEDPHYAYAVVNDERVIVDPDTRTVVKVVD